MKHVEILEPWQAIAIAREKKNVRYVREPNRRIEKPVQVKFLPAEDKADEKL